MVLLAIRLVCIAAPLMASFPFGLVSGQESDQSREPGSFMDRLEAEGYVQLYASLPRTSNSSANNEYKVAEEFEIRLRLEPLEWLGTEFGWLHEHEYDEEEGRHEPGIFTAAVVVEPHQGSWWLKGGIQFLPLSMFDVAGVHAVHDRSIGSAVTGTIMDTVSDEHSVLRDVPAFDETGIHAVHDRSIGPFETGAIVDPVSYEYGVMREKSVILGKAIGPFVGNVYGYYGNDRRTNDSRFGYGGALGFRKRIDGDDEFNLNLSYIDDLGIVESYQEEVFDQEEQTPEDNIPVTPHDKDRVPGWSVATHLVLGSVTMTGEYLLAQDRFGSNVLKFDGRGARPSAWAGEARYEFSRYGRNGFLMLGYQGSSEALELALPARRYVAVFHVDLWNEMLYGTFEWIRNEDYGITHYGTGTNEDRYTFLVGFEF